MVAEDMTNKFIDRAYQRSDSLDVIYVVDVAGRSALSGRSRKVMETAGPSSKVLPMTPMSNIWKGWARGIPDAFVVLMEQKKSVLRDSIISRSKLQRLIIINHHHVLYLLSLYLL